MKKIILLSFFSLSAMLIVAQPALTWLRPPFGTTKNYNVFTGSIPEPTVGADQVWDYSAVSPNSYGSGVYTDPSTLPASAFDKFPDATYVEVWNGAPSLEQAVIDFYYDCADSLVRLGQQSSGGNNSSTWGDVQGVWNIAFGESAMARYQDPMTGQLVLGSYTYAGYGTLSTKYGSYDDVIMISRNGAKTFFSTTPYFGMLMNVLYSNETTIAGAYIYSYGSAVGVSDLPVSQKPVISSSLNNNEVIIDLDNYNGHCDVFVIDLLGRTVYQNVLTFDAAKQILTLDNIGNGYYLVKIRYDDKFKTAKVLLSK